MKKHTARKQRPLVVAVITHWNALEDTTECIESTFASDYTNLDIVVVDNGSTDNSPQKLSERYPFVTLLQTGHNGAVTAAYNQGVNFGLDSGADYILMLNNDTTIDSAMISTLVETAETSTDIGIVTPKVYYYDRPDVIWFAGGMRSRFDFGAYDTHEGETDSPANSTQKEVDYAWACGMLMRRELLDKMGLFDTAFYLYYDDVDTSIRTQQAGYKIWYKPEAKMWHKVSHSTGSPKFTFVWARSKMRLIRKHARGLHQISLILYAFLHGLSRMTFPKEDNRRMHTHPLAYFRGLAAGLRR